jgi:hypothetical protein
MFLVGKLEASNKDLYSFLTLIVVALYFAGAWKLSKTTSKAKMIIQIMETGLRIEWERNYILYKYSNRLIEWKDIIWYKFTPDQHFDIFKIRLKGKSNFKFEHASEENDDFRSFLASFKRHIREKNYFLPECQMIKEAPNMYEGMTGKVLLGLGYLTLAAGIILIPWAIIKGQKINLATILGMLAAMSGGIFTIRHVKTQQKNKKSA